MHLEALESACSFQIWKYTEVKSWDNLLEKGTSGELTLSRRDDCMVGELQHRPKNLYRSPYDRSYSSCL